MEIDINCEDNFVNMTKEFIKDVGDGRDISESFTEPGINPPDPEDIVMLEAKFANEFEKLHNDTEAYVSASHVKATESENLQKVVFGTSKCGRDVSPWIAFDMKDFPYNSKASLDEQEQKSILNELREKFIENYGEPLGYRFVVQDLCPHHFSILAPWSSIDNLTIESSDSKSSCRNCGVNWVLGRPKHWRLTSAFITEVYGFGSFDGCAIQEDNWLIDPHSSDYVD